MQAIYVERKSYILVASPIFGVQVLYLGVSLIVGCKSYNPMKVGRARGTPEFRRGLEYTAD